MACCLFGAKPLSIAMLGYCQLNKLQWNFNQNTRLFVQENASENIICEMVAILSRGGGGGGGWVKPVSALSQHDPVTPHGHTHIPLVPRYPPFRQRAHRVADSSVVGSMSTAKPTLTYSKLHQNEYTYREISNTRRTKSQNLNYSRLVLQLAIFVQSIEAKC